MPANIEPNVTDINSPPLVFKYPNNFKNPESTWGLLRVVNWKYINVEIVPKDIIMAIMMGTPPFSVVENAEVVAFICGNNVPNM